jgi:hypothetical protein
MCLRYVRLVRGSISTKIPDRYGISNYNYSRMIAKFSVGRERTCAACASVAAMGQEAPIGWNSAMVDSAAIASS